MGTDAMDLQRKVQEVKVDTEPPTCLWTNLTARCLGQNLERQQKLFEQLAEKEAHVPHMAAAPPPQVSLTHRYGDEKLCLLAHDQWFQGSWRVGGVHWPKFCAELLLRAAE